MQSQYFKVSFRCGASGPGRKSRRRFYLSYFYIFTREVSLIFNTMLPFINNLVQLL